MAAGTPSEGDLRCEGLATLTSDHLFTAKGLTDGLQPLEASELFREAHGDQMGPAGPWGTTPIVTALSLALIRTAAAADHLGGLTDLIKPPVPAYAPASLARSSIENASVAYWLLEPSIGSGPRVSRYFGDCLISAREQEATVALITDQYIEIANNASAQLRTRMAELGVEAEPRPSHTDLCGEILAPYVTRPGGGKGIYKYLAALSHGTLYALLQRYRAVGESADDVSRPMERFLPVRSVELMVIMSVRAHSSAVTRVLQLTGGDLAQWQRWMQEFDRRWTAGVR